MPISTFLELEYGPSGGDEPVEVGSGAGPGAFGYVPGVGYTRPRRRTEASETDPDAFIRFLEERLGGGGGRDKSGFLEGPDDVVEEGGFRFSLGRGGRAEAFQKPVVDVPFAGLLQSGPRGEKVPGGLEGLSPAEVSAITKGGPTSARPQGGPISGATIRPSGETPDEAIVNRATEALMRLKAEREGKRRETEEVLRPVRVARAAGERNPKKLGAIYEASEVTYRRPEMAGKTTLAREEAKEPFREERETERRERADLALENRKEYQSFVEDLRRSRPSETTPAALRATVQSVLNSKISALMDEADLLTDQNFGIPTPEAVSVRQVAIQLRKRKAAMLEEVARGTLNDDNLKDFVDLITGIGVKRAPATR